MDPVLLSSRFLKIMALDGYLVMLLYYASNCRTTRMDVRTLKCQIPCIIIASHTPTVKTTTHFTIQAVEKAYILSLSSCQPT